ncbi:type VII secretion protein EccB [Actinoplanes regularis]|uniref:Type VII secretion protein EccB n=1 Tax=Actinoplanes regularis TaxID=52697 RepID=A0A238WME8_9ACTN|nr:type VII secretion protein EccB [Actinoplanes regularis]SNR47424.1 type VII secretion protein EccB [Actinoplanes regularis]
MTSRRDQLQSYQFLNQRVISAFVMRETDPAQSPLRRGIGALFGGLMVAILIGAGFGIYGILTKVGTDQWKSDGSVVVERESGASFVYLGGRLNPALNFTSAKLAAGRANPVVYRVAAKALAGTPRGVTIGIPNAPASLPAAGQRVGLPWSMCLVPGANPTGTLLVGSTGPAGTDLGDKGLLVSTGADDIELVWHGRKHKFRNAQTTLPALYGAVDPTLVSTAWLNALPAGTDIAAVQVQNRGARSARVANFVNGQVLAADFGVGNKQFYLVLDNGLLPITALQRALLNASFPAEPTNVPVTVVNNPADAPQLKPAGNADAQPPATPPTLATVAAGTTACAVTRVAAKAPSITIGGAAAGLSSAVPTAGSVGGRALADAIGVPAGMFALVKVPGSGGYQLVTDLGVRHAVPDADALGRLGYAATSATEVPTALVNTIPAGVTLDPAAAIKPAGG